MSSIANSQGIQGFLSPCTKIPKPHQMLILKKKNDIADSGISPALQKNRRQGGLQLERTSAQPPYKQSLFPSHAIMCWT